MVDRLDVVRALADGEIHSGERVAAVLGVSRAAIWKHVSALEACGLTVEAVRGRGYRLAGPLELLEAQAVLDHLDPRRRAALARLELLGEVDSTSAHLARLDGESDVHAHACLAEYQHAGRGRRGRQWAGALASGVCLSLGWRFESSIDSLAALSLAVAVAAVRALERLGVGGVAIKWPNDLLWGGGKLGGILVELSGEAAGPVTVIVGIGINVALPSDPPGVLAPPPTDLRRAAGRDVARNAAAGLLLDETLALLEGFASTGFEAVAEQWRARDCLRGRPVTVERAGETVAGVAAGIADDGALLVDAAGGRRRFVSGDVSVRARP